jgi:hypothetical protein
VTEEKKKELFRHLRALQFCLCRLAPHGLLSEQGQLPVHALTMDSCSGLCWSALPNRSQEKRTSFLTWTRGSTSPS